MATRTTRAAVLIGAGRIEVREFALPLIGADDAILRVEVCGMCGTDLDQFQGAYSSYPTIPGHEPVGIVEEIGERARLRWGANVGDRVAVFPRFGCGECGQCAAGRTRECPRYGLYGFTGADRPPGLWGGYADHLYLAPGTVLRRFPPAIAASEAVLFNPLGAGYKWAVGVPGTHPGDDVVIFGSGQRGLACLVAAREAGARSVTVTGLSRDAHKLALALELGADAAVDVETDDVSDVVAELTAGKGARVVVDTTPHATGPIVDAVRVAAKSGTVVLAGLKGTNTLDRLAPDDIVNKELTLVGVRGADDDAFEMAAQLIESRRYPLHRLHTHSFALEQVELALDVLAGRVPGEQPVNVTIDPSRSPEDPGALAHAAPPHPATRA
jgi:threonine dehydrogenase-like Zn-dependent dehydrogenase